MTDAEKQSLVKTMTGETDEAVVIAYLQAAGAKILRKAYPYGAPSAEVPDKYAFTQVEIAVYLLNKRGAEGETAHSENGISRTYENADVPSTLLRDIVPFVGVMGGGSA